MIRIKHPYGIFDIYVDEERGKTWWLIDEVKKGKRPPVKVFGIYKSFNTLQGLYEYIAHSHYLSVEDVKQMAEEVECPENLKR